MFVTELVAQLCYWVRVRDSLIVLQGLNQARHWLKTHLQAGSPVVREMQNPGRTGLPCRVAAPSTAWLAGNGKTSYVTIHMKAS